MPAVIVERLRIQWPSRSTVRDGRTPFPPWRGSAITRWLSTPRDLSGRSEGIGQVHDRRGDRGRVQDQLSGREAGRKYASASTRTPLGEVIHTDLTPEGTRLVHGPRHRRKGFFFRAETLFNLGQNVSGMYGFWEEPLTEQSHGEGFTVLEAMFTDRPNPNRVSTW
jgi:hypothetical protein